MKSKKNIKDKIEIISFLSFIMKFITFNVNGIRSISNKLKNGQKQSSHKNCLQTLLEEQQPDFLCLQEIKTQNESDLDSLTFYFPHRYTNFSKNKKQSECQVSESSNVKTRHSQIQ